MLELPLYEEAQRQLEICNACRYCEGVCAVFPALERRSFFSEGDVSFLANLCHDCRACFYVCPFAPPHEFAVNIPKLMSEVREIGYRHYAWPRLFSQFVERSWFSAAAVGILSVLAVVIPTLLAHGIDGLLAVRIGPGAFYQVIPWPVMMLPALAISLYALAILLVGVIRFWRHTGGRDSLTGLRAVLAATWDVLSMRNMRGGGPGCHYPSDRHSHRRWIFHSLVFYGFISAFIATTLAAIYQDFFALLPPYPMLSAPVLFGTVGGVAMILGSLGLLWLKLKSNRSLADPTARAMDFAFLASLLLVNVTGMLLLALRETAAMALLLDIHLGFVVAFFVTAPYGKFVHSAYRYGALVRDRLEQERAQRGTA